MKCWDPCKNGFIYLFLLLICVVFWQSDSEGKRLKTSGCRDDNGESKAEAQPNSGKSAEQNNRPPDPPKQDYIHVRARRGQATDSHSLAERVIICLKLLSGNFL